MGSFGLYPFRFDYLQVFDGLLVGLLRLCGSLQTGFVGICLSFLGSFGFGHHCRRSCLSRGVCVHLQRRLDTLV